MANIADRIPVSKDYLQALGRATYNFSYLEWDIIWLHETIQRGSIRKAANRTAGTIAKKFSSAVETLDKADPNKFALRSLAGTFSELVDLRNRLLHGNPHTAVDGEQRLLYNGRAGRKDWAIDQILEFADRTAAASIVAGEILNCGRYAAYIEIQNNSNSDSTKRIK